MRWTLSLTVVPVIVLTLFTMEGRAADLPGLAPETVTDYIHAVIEADRTFYTIHIVERLQKQGGAPTAENWRTQKKTLPLPAQFLAEASNLSSMTGTRVRYRLISLWPINPQNGPDDESEKKGLDAVREHPEQAAHWYSDCRQSDLLSSHLRRSRRQSSLRGLSQYPSAQP
jgi:hypothetical protein